jgi:HEAT repeat protein
MGIAASFETIAGLPVEQRLALVEAALRDTYPPLQAAAFALLADPAGLNRPDLLVVRHASLPSELRQRMSNQKDRFLPAALALARSEREIDRRAGLAALFALDPYESAPVLARALEDPAPVVHETAAGLLDELGQRFYYHLVAARLHADPESRAYLTEYGPRMLSLLPALLRLYPKHAKAVFFDIAIESEPDSYALIVDHVLVRGAAPTRQAFLEALAASATEQAVRILFRLSAERIGRMRETAAEVYRRRRDPGFPSLVAATLFKLPPEEFAALAQKMVDLPWWPEAEALGEVDSTSSARLLDFAAASALPPRRRDELILGFRRSPYPATRVKVLSVLQVLDHPRFAELAEEALGDPDDEVKTAAARALIGLNPPHKAKLLMPLLNSTSDELRRLAQREVASAGVDRYLKAFDRLDGRTRETAVRALAKIDARVVERLLEELASAEPARRLAALRALHVLGVEEAHRERLRPLLADPDVRVRATAQRVVKAGFEAWAAALDDPDARVRANAIESLEEAADPRAVEALLRRLDDPSPRARANAAKALCRYGRDEGRRALEAMARHADDAARLSAAWAIGQVRFEGALVLLHDRANVETNPAVFAKIADALSQFQELRS